MNTMQGIKSVRNSNIELSRCFCIYGIIIMHIWDQFRQPGMVLEKQISASLVICLCTCCVPLFMMISGYYGIRMSIYKFIKYEVAMIICSLIATITAQGGDVSTREIVNACFPIYSNTFWFMTIYMIMMLFSDFISFFIDMLSKNQFEKLLVLMFIVYDVIPFMLNKTLTRPDAQDIINMLFVYFVGAYIRRYGRKKWTVKRVAIMTACLYILTVLLTLGYEHIKNRGTFLRLVQHQSPITVVLTVGIFYCLIYMKPQKIDFINRIAKYTIYVYLFDSVYRGLVVSWFHFSMEMPYFSMKAIGISILICALGWVTGLILDVVIGNTIDWGISQFQKYGGKK